MPDETTKNSKLRFSLDLRWVVGVLLAVIVLILFLWQPWRADGERTISVSGEATITAEPDEYVFQPTYQFEQDDADAALAALTEKSDALVGGLKSLGVGDSQIKTSANNDHFPGLRDPAASEPTYTLSLIVTVSDKDLAQKVQDYLLRTSPAGAVSPYVTFSENKRRELEHQARDEATKDARAKAEQSAGNLGFTIGEVKEVSDGSGFGVYPLRGADLPVAEDSSGSLKLQPGENDIYYSVTVVYFLR